MANHRVEIHCIHFVSMNLTNVSSLQMWPVLDAVSHRKVGMRQIKQISEKWVSYGVPLREAHFGVQTLNWSTHFQLESPEIKKVCAT